MSSASAPASEASSSDSNSLTAISERLSEAAVSWRGKQLPPQAWSRQWKRGGFIQRLSGLTLEPSTAQAGVDSWISSLRAIRAKETASPESGSGNSMTDGCSTAPSTSSTRRGLILSSARTCRGTRTDSSPLPFRHWSDWAAALRSEYSARPKLAIPCAGSDCSSWPAASVMDTADSTDPQKLAERRARHKARGINGNGFGVSLGEMAMNWAGPQARDHFPPHSREYIAAKKAQGHGMRNLNDEAANWPAPAARDHKGTNSPEHLLVSTGHCIWISFRTSWSTYSASRHPRTSRQRWLARFARPIPRIPTSPQSRGS